MTVKVVGAGFGRTGTLSLKYALEMLGFDKCYHMMEVQFHPEHVAIWRQAARGEPIDWHSLFDGYQATVDWPSCNFWREQLEAYPDAKVILSRRDPERWYESVMNTIWKVSRERPPSDDPRAKEGSAMAFEVIWDGVFDRRMDDKDHVISVYEAHNQAVIDELPADKLLVFEASQGWEPLCAFLDRPVPDQDYPRVNSSEEFTERWKSIAQEADQREQ
jgi:hypothetical protein